MKKIYIFLFTLILLVGIFFRFYKLGEIPNSLNWDEVSWGYNAYSILKTGMDEHGVVFPFSFQAFGDYKQPVYVYLASLSVRFFGLNAFAVRFPSALLGSLTIPLVFFFVYEIFYRESYRKKVGLLVMLFFAISPWSIQFSRVAYEANVGLFFVTMGAALFVLGLVSKKKIYLYLSAVPLVISGYTYHSEKIFTPLLVLGLLVYAYFSFKVSKKTLFVISLLFLLGSMFWIVDPRTTARGRSVTFLSNQTQILQGSTEKLALDISHNDKLGMFLDNRRFAYVNKYLQNYLSHFDLNYLFVSGDDARHHAYGMGILYLISLPIIIIGLIKIDKKKYWLLFFWFFLAPTASSFAIDAPNSSRSLIFLPTWQIFEALGLYAILSYKNNYKWNLFKSLVIFLLLINVAYYSFNYFIHTNSEYLKYWQFGYKEAIDYTSNYTYANKKVFFANDIEQGYIFYLFYNQYDPQKYILNGGSNRVNSNCYAIDKAYFGTCKEMSKSGDLYVTSKEQSSSNFKIIKTISYSDNKIAVWILEYL
jgi:4-amino-4-deoxy-L-arabinose transferase-like glycosyltransferase